MQARTWVGSFLLVAASASASGQDCTAPAAWFPHAQTPVPGLTVEDESACSFYRWSWQTLLYVTQTVDGDLRFITGMYTPEQVFNEGYYAAHPQKKAPGKFLLHLRPRDTKPLTVRGLGGIEQAGGNGVLVDQRGRAVYYATHLNRVYRDFVRGRGYNNPLALKNAPPADKFPVGTLMLKSAWRVVGPDEDTSGYFTTTAEIEQLKTDDEGHVVVDTEDVRPERVTLVGLHVVGYVEHHPEFVWATFEHRRNSPPLPAGQSPGSVGPVSAADTTFYAANTPARECNVSNAGRVEQNPPGSQTLRPITNVFRQYAQGGGADAALIRSLNESVRTQLGQDVWANYELIGSLWSAKQDDLEPNRIPDPEDQRGSVSLANTTMETFQQAAGNCFSCHNTRPYTDAGVVFAPKNLNLSHATRQTFMLTAQMLPAGVPTPRPPKAPTR